MEAALAFVPVGVALVVMLWSKNAALSLLLACVAAALVLSGGNPLTAGKELMISHAFPALSGSWHIGPVLFTLLLGAFASVVESSGGFKVLMRRWRGSDRKTLFGVFFLGIVCFFDGLANAMLVGRVARPLMDEHNLPRQLLAYIVDSTSSSVACVAFVSTWIATQLSLIHAGLEGSGHGFDAVQLFFASIPANPYCWLSLLMVVLVIWRRWWIGPMAKYVEQYQSPVATGEECEDSSPEGKVISAIAPVFVLFASVPACIYLLQEGEQWSWKNAFSGSYVPHAMVLAGCISLVAACLFFPRKRWSELAGQMLRGVASMLVPLVILWLAWTFGSQIKELGVAGFMNGWMESFDGLHWLPLGIFVVVSLMSFFTGSSWGTMSLCMPVVIVMVLGHGFEVSELGLVLPIAIGAVFGGAVFGDHCSPFSDTTVVSSMSSGCSMTSHVSTQLPYALIVSGASVICYVLMALGMVPLAALAIVAFAMIVVVYIVSGRVRK